MNKAIERVFSQPEAPGMVGDGFRVYNYIPGGGIHQRRIDPFLLLDFNAEIDFPPSAGHLRGVGAHPHKGFETVTIAYKGSVAHHDSFGNSGTIHPGDVQWMTAGAGILHKEYHDKEYALKGGPFEMVQLWVNLPKKDKLTKPHYQAITAAQMGKLQLPGGHGEVNVIAGTFNGVDGPAHTYSPLVVADIRLHNDATEGAAANPTADRASITTSLPADQNTALLLVKGSAIVNGEKVPEHAFVLFTNEGEDITIATTDNDAVILLLSGRPLNEPIARYGPFVMNNQEELLQSIREAETGAYGRLD
jgi:redox-sensitive bicupin YhaK (pirin superfamily)